MNARQLIRRITEEEELDAKTFLEKRQEGAANVAEEARSKGGPALLTAIHFEAKAEPYASAIDELKDGQEDMASHAEEILAKLADWKNLSMDEFQRFTGQFEAWGECYIKSKES